ncbi:hypothetical protein HPB51_022672 [Rhipicephalus microplus]|uniref:Uncharacterized protein n=1 Tax=Rhipicephalus microplus TaxID=6941 RepID=A0A9J6D777_RHIMP|nr:hypothetical protein HPB51_022672 [Rhipicephalus microplus]
MVESLDMCSTLLHQLLGLFTASLQMCWFESALQIRSVVQQVSLTLAVSEAALEFEHRALTPSHVLVREALDQVVPFCLNGHTLRVDMFGVHVSLIDLSTARLTPAGQETV